MDLTGNMLVTVLMIIVVIAVICIAIGLQIQKKKNSQFTTSVITRKFTSHTGPHH
jgi:Tfp pilus assembly protein PilX